MYNLSTMAETGLPLTIQDTQKDPHWVPFSEVSWLRSMASAPIRVKGSLVGFLHLDSAKPNFYTHMHAEKLQAFADHVGAAIENARLFEEAQKRARQLALLNEITQSAITAPDLQTMLEILANRLGELIDADGAYITLWDNQEDRAIPKAAYGSQADQYLQIPSSPGELSFTASA
jgi:GAF domain-containing protein